ncbi:helix-turn-helix transcriptional regulator [Tamlana sp. 2201CG12-4]|uniref:response regulator transcription factor n=1 Tax=Tamlana sp. 2201CG12-4 TaxID=3112582 RepID=UPI002DB6D26F|nr:helix-turn-helix transcriptional regulator [Tamlana sp. 2201CG12-4]MEC3908737.1 helix-turn-helix transcriptional regulator [Tamlana sp. 2201CG12-4]
MSRKSSHKEDQESLHKSIYKIDSLLKKKLTLEEIGDLLPGSLHVNSLKDFSVSFMDKSGENIYKHPIEEVISGGVPMLQKIIHPDEFLSIPPLLQKYVEQKDNTRSFSFFQRFKAVYGKHHEWYFTNCKLSQLGLISITHPIKDLRNHVVLIEKVLEEHTFFKKHFKKFQSLTKRKKEVLKELAIGKTAPQISDEFCISVNTVKTHRQRIFEKLDASTFTELYKYAFHFDLL